MNLCVQLSADALPLTTKLSCLFRATINNGARLLSITFPFANLYRTFAAQPLANLDICLSLHFCPCHSADILQPGRSQPWTPAWRCMCPHISASYLAQRDPSQRCPFGQHCIAAHNLAQLLLHCSRPQLGAFVLHGASVYGPVQLPLQRKHLQLCAYWF